MNYQRTYELLIQRGRTVRNDLFTERHHVVPKCFGGSDDVDNIVRLTPDEHRLAHLLLHKMYPEHRGLMTAALLMSQGRRIFSSARRLQSALMRSNSNPNKLNPRRGERHHFFGKTGCFSHSEDGRRLLSEQKQGDKNPFHGAWGWRHPTCTEESKKVWARADEVLRIHLENPKMGYSRVSKTMGLSTPFAAAGVLAKIKEGWNPLIDNEWREWTNGRT